VHGKLGIDTEACRKGREVSSYLFTTAVGLVPTSRPPPQLNSHTHPSPHQDIPVPEVDPGANSWEKGPAYQFELKEEAATTTMPTALPGAGVYGSSASL
jgi:hypothetical protein